MKCLSRVRLFATPWTGAYQASLSMGFSRQEFWSGLPFPSLGYTPVKKKKRRRRRRSLSIEFKFICSLTKNKKIKKITQQIFSTKCFSRYKNIQRLTMHSCLSRNYKLWKCIKPKLKLIIITAIWLARIPDNKLIQNNSFVVLGTYSWYNAIFSLNFPPGPREKT